ncbi:MAG: nucleotide exchange factor GrpE [Deltaproteobacteria bacterium]|nr:MAG: nucleotide exchange factor GrpE [Deltaproteobacteria bacterium]
MKKAVFRSSCKNSSEYAQDRDEPDWAEFSGAEIQGTVSAVSDKQPVEMAVKPLKRKLQKIAQIQEMGFEDLTDRLTRIETALEAKTRQTVNAASGGLTAEQSHDLIALADSLFYILRQFDDPDTLRILKERIDAVLAAFGLSMLPLEDIPFDDRHHEVREVGSDPQRPNIWILQTLRPGYLYNGRLLRPAWVVVNRLDNQ